MAGCRIRIFNVHLAVLSAMLATILGCNAPHAELYSDEEYQNVDSVVRQSSSSIEALEGLAVRFGQEKNALGIVVVCRELGNRYRENSRFIDAINCHKRGLAAAESIGDTLDAITALNSIGTNYRRMGILDEASSFHYQALLLCEQYSEKGSQKAKKSRVVSLNGIGNVHLTLGNKETADSVFRISLAGERELGSDLGQAINYANLGSIFESRGLIDSAWVYYRLSMKHNEAAKSALGVSLCHTHFGRLYEHSGQWDNALKEYSSAYDIMEKNSDSWHWLESCLALARVNISKGDLHSARVFLQKAQTTAESIGSLEHIAEAYRQYYRWYDKQGDSHSALNCYLRSQMYSDSVSNSRSQNNMQNIRVKYEREKRQNELDLVQRNYESEQRLKNIFIIAAVTILLLSAIVVAFLWYALKMRSQNQKVMRDMEKMRTDFFTNITHEFRTPLTVILGFGKQIQEGYKGSAEELKKLGEMIVRQGDSLLELINQLLDISKVKSAIGEPDWKTGDIVAYMRMIVESYQVYAQQSRIELSFVPRETSVTMDFVPDYIRKTICNLLSNALKFTPQYGRIYITSHQEKDNYIVQVADSGGGIAEDDLPHIFQPFFQGRNSLRSNGTGVGLSLVQQLIATMGGHIDVVSQQGEGTVFTITLPMKHGSSQLEAFAINKIAEEMPMPSHESAIDFSNEESSDKMRPIVLIVEDNVDVSYYIGSQLNRDYNLIYAKNGGRGL